MKDLNLPFYYLYNNSFYQFPFSVFEDAFHKVSEKQKIVKVRKNSRKSLVKNYRQTHKMDYMLFANAH